MSPKPETEITSDLDRWPRDPAAFAAIGAQHLAPIAWAVRNAGCRLAIIRQHGGPFNFAAGEPIIGLVGDDTKWSHGPAAFPRRSMARFVATCHAVAIISSGPEVAAYTAVLGAPIMMRKNAAIIETQPANEAAWLDLVLQAQPDVQLVFCRPRPH